MRRCRLPEKQWCTLADEALKNALHDSQAMREFIGIDLGREDVPGATTLLEFRRLLEQHDLTSAIQAEVNAHLTERGKLMRQGTVVDATIIAAPSSTKNSQGERDPEMHQTKKVEQWHFGMTSPQGEGRAAGAVPTSGRDAAQPHRIHTGVDADPGLVHGVVCTAANEADVVHTHELLHGQERRGHGNSGNTGVHKRGEITRAQDEGRLHKDIDWRIAIKPGQLRGMPEGPLKALTQICERIKARVRARVEHPFHVIKNLFGYRKVSYRGIAKNETRAKAQAALANLYIARRRLMAQRVSASAESERGRGSRLSTFRFSLEAATSRCV